MSIDKKMEFTPGLNLKSEAIGSGYPNRRGAYGPVETDPTGRGSREAGAKLDSGKVEPELIFRGFSRALYAVAEVGTKGLDVYSRDGWAEVPEGERRYTNAMYRHLLAAHRGEHLDAKTGCMHDAQVAWNALARLELKLRPRTND